MSNLLVQNIKHTNNTSAQTIDTSGRTTVSIMNNDSTFRSDGGAATQNLVQGLIKSWNKTTADGTALEDSFNVSSLTDTNTGQQTINISNNMSNDDYCPTHSYIDNQTDIAPWIDSVATGSYKQNSYHSGAYIDRKHASSVNGDLA